MSIEPRVLKTPSAERDLLEIADFIYRKSHHVGTTLRFLDKIAARAHQHARQPLMGEAFRCRNQAELRFFTVGAYVIVYRLIPDGIELLLVARGTRRLTQLLRDRLEEIE